MNCYRQHNRKLDEPKGSPQATDKACGLYQREDSNSRNIEAVTEEDPEGRKCYTVHIPDRYFGDVVNQKLKPSIELSRLCLYMFVNILF